MTIPSSQFRSGISGTTRFLSSLENRPLAELLFKDVMAFNLPKIALTRTREECLDTATLELSNSAITLLSSLAVPPVLRRPVSWISGIPLNDLKTSVAKQVSTPIQMARLGVAFGFLFPFAAAFWAVPFARNYLTLQRTKSANFESMIGFEDTDNLLLPPPRSFDEEKNYQKGMASRILLTGVGLGAASLLGFSLAARHALRAVKDGSQNRLTAALENRYAKLWRKFFDNYDLKGKSANQVAPGLAQLIFWGLPAYSGWIHAARGKNERRERTLQAANGVFWFFFGGKVTGMLFNRAYSRLQEARQPEFWKKEFLEKVVDHPLPDKGWEMQFKQNADFMNKLHRQLKNLSYKDIQENAVSQDSETYQKLITLKNWKFGMSGLATPIIALALVQLINFAITARKIKSQSLLQYSLASDNESTPVNNSSFPPTVINRMSSNQSPFNQSVPNG
jgi:hypothetical protein